MQDAGGGLARAEPVNPQEVAMDSGERSLIINYARVSSTLCYCSDNQKLVDLQRGEFETETTQSANATTEKHIMRFHLGTSHLPIDAIGSAAVGAFSKQASAGSDFMVEIRRWRREWLSSMDIGKSLSSSDLTGGRGPEPSMTSLHPDDVVMVVHRELCTLLVLDCAEAAQISRIRASTCAGSWSGTAPSPRRLMGRTQWTSGPRTRPIL